MLHNQLSPNWNSQKPSNYHRQPHLSLLIKPVLPSRSSLIEHLLRAFLGPGEKQRDSQSSCEALSLHSKWGKRRNRGHPRTGFKHVCAHTLVFPLSHLSFIEALTANIHEPGTVPSKQHTPYVIFHKKRKKKQALFTSQRGRLRGVRSPHSVCSHGSGPAPSPPRLQRRKGQKQLCVRRGQPLAPSAALSTVGGQSLLHLEAKP